MTYEHSLSTDVSLDLTVGFTVSRGYAATRIDPEEPAIATVLEIYICLPGGSQVKAPDWLTNLIDVDEWQDQLVAAWNEYEFDDACDAADRRYEAAE